MSKEETDDGSGTTIQSSSSYCSLSISSLTSSTTPTGGGAAASGEQIKLISSEGDEFLLDSKSAFGCELIRNMCESQAFQEGVHKTARFTNINTNALKFVVDYLLYKQKYSSTTGPLPEFQIPPSRAVDLLITANYLGI